MRVWDITTMKLLMSHRPQPEGWRPESRRPRGGSRGRGEPQPVVVSGGTSGGIWVSQLRTGAVIGEFREHRSGVRVLTATRLGQQSGNPVRRRRRRGLGVGPHTARLWAQ